MKQKKRTAVIMVFVLIIGLMFSACAQKEQAAGSDSEGTGLGKKESQSSSASDSGSETTGNVTDGSSDSGNNAQENGTTENGTQENSSSEGAGASENQTPVIGALIPTPVSGELISGYSPADSSLAGPAEETPTPTPTKKPTPTPTSTPTPTPSPTPTPTPTEGPKKVSYTIMCVTPDDDTLEGVEFKICNDDSCWIVKSDFFGAAVFKNYPGKYTVSVKSVPAGYVYRGGDFTLTKNKQSYEIQLDFADSDSGDDKDDEPSETGSSKADDFYVYTSSGSKVSLSSFSGKPVIINCWATWCSPCVNELPHFQKLYEEYGSKVKFMMVNCESRSSSDYVKSFLEAYGYDFPVYYDFDDSLSDKYSTGYIPYTITIDSKGKLHKNAVGGKSESELREMIRDIL